MSSIRPDVVLSRVEFSVVEDVRRALFLELEGLPERQRSKLALRLTAKLRDGGWLTSGVEQHFKAVETAALISRTPEFVVKQCKAGRFGPVYRDDGGWLVPASGVQSWLAERLFSGLEVTP